MQSISDNLNEAQRQAVSHGPGPLLVLAGPGSGKTVTIVKRIQYLIKIMHVPPEEILVITFTKDAARSMQQRFTAQSDKSLPVNFGTFHSVFYHILLQSSVSREKMEILSESRKRSLICPVLKKIKQQNAASSFSADNLSAEAAEMLSAISYYKNTGDEEGALKKLRAEWKPYFGEILEFYRKEAAARRALDFDDMVYECGRMLGNDRERRENWQKRFSHILVDEFQDINPMQYQVLRLLTKPPYNIFAVGDDDQAIYGFRGSSPACLKRFEEDFGAKRVLLNLNYRSGKSIVEAANRVIAENGSRYAKELRAASRTQEAGQAVRLLQFQEREQENTYLRKEIAAFLNLEPEKSCAVLFRTNTYMQSFGAGLKKEGIPFVMREKAQNIYEHFVVRDVMAYLQFAGGDRRRALFLQFMNKPARFLRREALADMDRVDFGRLKSWYREWGGPRRLDGIEVLERLETQIKALKSMPPRLAVHYVRHAIQYERYLKEQASASGEERLQEWLDILDWLKEDGAGYETVSEWLEAQNKYIADMQGRGAPRNAAGAYSAPFENPRNAVQLMTVHASKGLEFDRVWIPDCNEKTFPHGIMPDKEAVEEERRIFYVGMTRAKQSLELLCLTGTGERPRLMSRFLNPIAKDYSSSSMSSSNSQLSRYSSNASATFSYSSSSSM